MTYYGSKELAGSFRTVRKNTVIIADEIGEEHYGFRAAPETRTVAQMLVHIAISPRLALQIHSVEQRTTLEGFDFGGFLRDFPAEEQKPRSKVEIIAMLNEEGDRLGVFLDACTEEFLGQRVTFPPGIMPPSKTRFEMLLGVKEHEMHHRGQLMLIERVIGMVPHLTRLFQARVTAMSSGKQ
jgi:uncharacterized damage-inducible protein DinB